MDAENSTPDLDIGPAVAKLRFFRFAEYLLVFLAISSVAWLVDLYFLPEADQARLEQLFGSGFSAGRLSLTMVLLAVVVVVGILAYRAAGRLRPETVRRHLILVPIAAISLFVVGIIFFIQADGMFHRATVIRLLPVPSAIKLYDTEFNLWLSIQTPERQEEILAELHAQIDQEHAENDARAAGFEQAAFPVLARAEIAIGAGLACALGLWGLLGFARAPLRPGKTPMTYLDAVEQAGRKEKRSRFAGKPINRTRGLLYLLTAIAVILVQYFLPGGFGIGMLLAIVLGVVAFVALFRAKQYFQMSADSLLGKDKRPPILFLRSFSDDPKLNAAAGITHEGLAKLIDFSVETRLANHFMRFGPFIAVGSPQDTVPRIGAARAKLSDDEWQQAVTDWMAQSRVIVMYAGTTKWIGWELARIIEGGWTDKLIILFPPVLPFPGFFQATWLKKQKADILKRFEGTKAAFAGTKWENAWNVAEPETILCARPEADGRIAFVRSKRRSKDAYDLAAKAAHLGLLGAALQTAGTTHSGRDAAPLTA